MARVVFSSFIFLVALSGAACTLITDVDRSRIPQPQEPPVVTPDASSPATDAAPPAPDAESPPTPDGGPEGGPPDSSVLDGGAPDASPDAAVLDAATTSDAS